MTYREEKRDLFSVSEEYYLAHCISADFKMGAGIAAQFNKHFDVKNALQKAYPEYLIYFRNCSGGDCILQGRVLNLVTKERYFHKPTMRTMSIALMNMKRICEREGIKKIAMPTIGAGLDRLDWNFVSARIQGEFTDTDVEILVCRL